MPRFSPYTKGLSVALADALGEVRRIEREARLLDEDLIRARAAVTACESLLNRAAMHELASECAPVQSWQGRYGKRGALSGAVMRLIEAAHPEGVSTGELLRKLIPIFGLTFATAAGQNRWRKNSVRTALRALERAGKVRKTGLKAAANSEVWAFVPPRDATLAEIKASARAANATVVVPTNLAALGVEEA